MIDVHDVKLLQLHPSTSGTNVNRINVKAKVKGVTNPKAYITWSPNANDRYVPAMPNTRAVKNGSAIDINVWSPVGIKTDGTAYWFATAVRCTSL